MHPRSCKRCARHPLELIPLALLDRQTKTSSNVLMCSFADLALAYATLVK